ncbi:MAG: hypothetical protein H0Z28_12410 [Archaeoglobus sp.]|nr:hypothetical protein [Archaeoglobus sp.]
MSEIRFKTRTGEIIIDINKCKSCATFACVKACSLYGRSLYSIRDGKITLVDPENAERLCIEDLACEQDCQMYGNGAIVINLPFPELEEYRLKIR